MKIIWLGQAGLWFECGKHKIMIDPYLSDSVWEKEHTSHRRVEVDEDLLTWKPDIMLFTHNHLDHYDPDTVKRFVTEETELTVLSPFSVWNDVKKIGGKNNFILFDRHTEWSCEDICFKAVLAKHSDPSSIGILIEAEGKKYYITGDTLYNTEIFEDLPDDIYAVFLPVNGHGNNMNMTDAKRFCDRIKAKYVVPMHCGLFDEIDMHAFVSSNKRVPEFYKEITLE